MEEEPSWADHAVTRATYLSMAALVEADPSSLTGTDNLDAIVAAEKAVSLFSAIQMRLINAFAQPFRAGDPMRLAARLARKNCITGDDDPGQVRQYVPAAAASLAAAEIAAALRISPITAGNRVREAATMTSSLEPTLELMKDGRIDRAKARVILDQCQSLGNESRAQVQDIVLPEADRLSTSELRDLTSQAVMTVDPEGALERHQRAAARRELTMRPQPDSMASLNAYLPADGAVKIFQISDLLATSTAGSPGDTRGIGERRVDALVDIADHLLTHGYLDINDYTDRPLPQHGATQPRRTPSAADDPTGDEDAEGKPASFGNTDINGPVGDHVAEPSRSSNENIGDSCDTTDNATDCGADQDFGDRPSASTELDSPAESTGERPAATKPRSKRRRTLSRQGRRPHLSVIINESTLAGLDDRPGYLNGFGAIPADLARSIAQSAATITAQLADPATGMITHAGALTYRPTQALRDQIAALANVCQFPSCRQPVWRCDIDHRERFDHDHPAQGGRTDTGNTGPLCRRHHLFKHHTEWKVRPDPTRWTSPTGHCYASTGRPPLAAIDITRTGIHPTHGGTRIAERLDILTAFANATAQRSAEPDMPPEVPEISDIEELLTALLVKHALNPRPIEIDYVPDEGETEDDESPPF